MKNFFIGLMVISMLANASSSFARETKKTKSSTIQNEQVVTLNDCFKAALIRSETLATQQELVAQAEESYSRAWGNILPTVNASYDYLRKREPSSESHVTKLTASQPLFRGFRDFAALDATKTLIIAQKQAREWAGMQLYQDVTAGFYTLLAAQKDLEVLDQELALYDKRIKELEDRIKIGRSRITEVLTVKSSKAILLAQKEQIIGQLKVGKEVLAFLTGWDMPLKLSDKDKIPTNILPLEEYQENITLRPDVIAAQKNVEAANSNITVALGSHLPSVDLMSNYYVQQRGNWDATLNITMPIFSGGIIASNVRTAESQKKQQEILLSQVKRLAQEDIRSLYHNLNSTIAQTQALREAVDISKENYEANLKDYEFSLVTNLDVLQALTAYQEAKRSLEKSQYQAKIYYNQLEAAAANRLTLMNNWEE